MKTNKLPKVLFEKCIEFGLLKKETPYKCKQITDGVSSDIWYVNSNNKEFCIKRALSKLTVKEDWFAPVERNNYEAKYFSVCKKILPAPFPKILGHDKKKFILAMEWFNSKSYILWKKELLNKKLSISQAENIAKILAKIHSIFYNKKKYEKIFTNDKIFFDIRIEPYIMFTSKHYPKYKSNFLDAANSLVMNKSTIIHGDFSPKNILIGKKSPIILDAETACWGDPIFDLAFCSNHLILKSVLHLDSKRSYINLLHKFIVKYFSYLKIEKKDTCIIRFINLLPLLMLARVDGKSPVEYLNGYQKKYVRTFSQALLDKKTKNLSELFNFLEIYETR